MRSKISFAMVCLSKEGFKAIDQKVKNSKRRGYAAWFWVYKGLVVIQRVWGVGVSESRKLKYLIAKEYCDGILSKFSFKAIFVK